MKTRTLSLEIDTLVELTPAAAQQVNGGFATVSSPMPTPPVPAPTSSVMPTPPVHKHHRRHHHHH